MDLSINSYSTLNSAANNRPPPPPKEAGGPSTDELLSFLDSDTSGELSAEEIAADSGLSQIITDDAFTSADADGNGALSAQELETTRPLSLHDDLPPPPPSALSELASSSATGTDAASLFESLLEITGTDGTTDFAASLESAMANAQNMYDLMQDLFSSATA